MRLSPALPPTQFSHRALRRAGLGADKPPDDQGGEVHNLWSRHPAFLALIDQAPAYEAVEAALGPETHVIQQNSLVTYPGGVVGGPVAATLAEQSTSVGV